VLLVEVLVGVVVDVGTVVVVVDVEPGHCPFTGSTSPCRRCAGKAFFEIVISL